MHHTYNCTVAPTQTFKWLGLQMPFLYRQKIPFEHRGLLFHLRRDKMGLPALSFCQLHLCNLNVAQIASFPRVSWQPEQVIDEAHRFLRVYVSVCGSKRDLLFFLQIIRKLKLPINLKEQFTQKRKKCHQLLQSKPA